MLYGINKVSIISGHSRNANTIPSKYWETAADQVYSEGTAMYNLANFLNGINGVEDIRNGVDVDYSRTTRGKMMGATGSDLCLELHTNWSVNSSRKPNRGTMIVIVPLYNTIHSASVQSQMAEKILKPAADAMGLDFKIVTKKGSGAWDWYTFVSSCNKYKVPYPWIVEIGYHQDYANNEDLFRNEMYKALANVCEDTRGIPTAEYITYLVNNAGKDSLAIYSENLNEKIYAGSIPNGTLMKKLADDEDELYIECKTKKDPDGNTIAQTSSKYAEGFMRIKYLQPVDIKLTYEYTEPDEPDEPTGILEDMQQIAEIAGKY